MKKIILIVTTTVSLVLANQPIEQNRTMQVNGESQTVSSLKMLKKKLNSPFLIKQGLPHFTMLIKVNWDNPKLALSKSQKDKLLKVRKETLGAVMSEKPKIIKLQKEIIGAINSGAKPEELKNKVDKLAAKEAALTMVHLKCISDTKKILSKEQMNLLTSGSL